MTIVSPAQSLNRLVSIPGIPFGTSTDRRDQLELPLPDLPSDRPRSSYSGGFGSVTWSSSIVARRGLALTGP